MIPIYLVAEVVTYGITFGIGVWLGMTMKDNR